jgi:hypothetical protein
MARPEKRRDIVLDIALRTVAHVGPKPFAPLTDDPGTVVSDFQRFRAVEGGDPVGRSQVLRDELLANRPRCTVVTISDEPTGNEIAAAIEGAGRASTLVILTRDATDTPRQRDITNRAIDAAPDGVRVIHCPMRGLYDAGTLADVDHHLFTFGDPAISIRALVAVLADAATPTATMPVTVPGLPWRR